MMKYALGALLLLCATEAAAHEVWIDRQDDGAARIYFGEPGSGEVEHAGGELDKIANPVVSQGAQTALAVTRHEDHLLAPTSGDADVRLVDTSYEPWLNDETGAYEHAVFYARSGRTETESGLDFEIVPVAANSDTFVVRFQGAPVANAEVTTRGPDDAEATLTTDAEGRFTAAPANAGRHLIAASHEDAAPRTIQGHEVVKTYHVTTLTFVR